MRIQLDEATHGTRDRIDREQRLRAAGIRPARSASPWRDFPPVRTSGALRSALAGALMRLLRRGG